MSRTLSHAIVLGGSAAGLFAARVLSPNAHRVTVVERDSLPDAALHRKGTPQSRHANNVQPRAVTLLERWFPGVTPELEAAGAVRVSDETRVVMRGIRHARTRGAPTTLLMTRPVLDAVLRKRVRALPNVTLLTEHDVTGLQADPHGRITGVMLRGGEDQTTLSGDLVVDAMGRGSRGGRWLAALGYDVPAATELRVDVHYASRLFERRPEDLDGDRLALVSPTVDNPHGAVAFAVEGRGWLVTLFAYGGERPPTELEAFRAFARSLAAPDIGDLLTGARPLDDGAQFGYPTACLRRYDTVRALPDGYLCLGDTVCQLNPSYGQGITSAALQAEALDQALAANPRSLTRRYYKLAVAAASRPFKLSWSADLDLPSVVGPPSPTPAPIRAYLKRVMRAASHDPVVATAFRRVMGLVDAPPSLLRPSVAVRVLFGTPSRTSPTLRAAAPTNEGISSFAPRSSDGGLRPSDVTVS